MDHHLGVRKVREGSRGSQKVLEGSRGSQKVLEGSRGSQKVKISTKLHLLRKVVQEFYTFSNII